MPLVRTAPVIGLFAQVALLVLLSGIVDLSKPGWLFGLSCAVVLNGTLAAALARWGVRSLRPADWVTLVRLALAGEVAVLTVASLLGSTSVAALVALSCLALLLDAVDGWVARRTRTASSFGARFDMEVDALLILVLSVYVAGSVGLWVLAIGAMRYGFVMAGRLQPWLRGSPPYRYWCKVVAATQGVVLVVAAAEVVPPTVAAFALAVSFALLVESFGHEVWWLWRNRHLTADQVLDVPSGPGVRAVLSWTSTAAAVGLVWFALVAPNQLSALTWGAFLRIPLEGLVLVALAMILPRIAMQVLAGVAGVLLALLTIVKILDMGFFEELDRPFNPVSDWAYLGPAMGVLADSVGRSGAVIIVVAACSLMLCILVLMPLSLMHLTRLASRHRTRSARTVTALAGAWVLCAAFGAQVVGGAPIASTGAAVLAYDQVSAVRYAIHDKQVFADLLEHDAYRDTPGRELLTGLRGKDVVIAFVESYGRVAVADSPFSPRIEALLDSGTNRLRGAGFSTRSAFLTSPTFGGVSWLAHSTLQSGRWVDSQQRYDQLMASDRLTLSAAFGRAGWRTVSDVPSNDEDWPDGRSFYHYDALYDLRNVGYHGPAFSYASMPDQYVLAALQRLELSTPDRAPVMAEVDLVSSHTPWTPIPHLVDWAAVGDGSVFDGMPDAGSSPDEVWPDSERVQAAYGRSIEYTLSTLVSFVRTYGSDDLVLVVLGDHQPASIVSGDDASHDVPITIIAHDPKVLEAIAGWHWQNGLRPGPGAPLWAMSAFRNRFLEAYGPPINTGMVH